jgi:hypothetical protein
LPGQIENIIFGGIPAWGWFLYKDRLLEKAFEDESVNTGVLVDIVRDLLEEGVSHED